MRFSNFNYAAAVVACALAAPNARGQIVVAGADGSDGAFSPTSSVQVNLANAVPGLWSAPSGTPGAGIYDGQQWLVVYKYSSVNIPAGVTVTYANHPSRAPVVWLVSGDVTISGVVDLTSQPVSTSGGPTQPGPGGFRGGERCEAANTPLPSGPGSAGFGPGGGSHAGSCGSNQAGAGGHAFAGGGAFGGIAYGNATAIPLMGGSGGARAYNSQPTTGGAGGGAILIAAQGTVTINGASARIRANADGNLLFSWGGAGGTVRIACNTLAGTGRIEALGAATGSDGRIRVEANAVTLPAGNFSPTTTPVPVAVGGPAIVPSDAAANLAITQIGTVNVPLDAFGRTELGLQDASLTRPGLYEVGLRLRNLNPAQAVVRARVVPISGAAASVDATFVSGTTTESLWRAVVPFSRGATVVMGSASRVVGAQVQQPTAFSREVSGYSIFCWVDLDDDGVLANGGSPDGGVTVDDLLFFLEAFEQGSAAADLDDNGIDPANPDGGVTIDDLLFFLSHFEAGC